jgi:hypothetical protein
MSNFSWRQMLAPWIGGAAGYAAAHGLALTGDQTAALTGMAAAAIGGAMHWLESKLSPAAKP